MTVVQRLRRSQDGRQIRLHEGRGDVNVREGVVILRDEDVRNVDDVLVLELTQDA